MDKPKFRLVCECGERTLDYGSAIELMALCEFNGWTWPERRPVCPDCSGWTGTRELSDERIGQCQR